MNMYLFILSESPPYEKYECIHV